jgi:hypothetical protein
MAPAAHRRRRANAVGSCISPGGPVLPPQPAVPLGGLPSRDATVNHADDRERTQRNTAPQNPRPGVPGTAMLAGHQSAHINWAAVCAWRHRGLLTERDWRRVASDAIGDVLDRQEGARTSGGLGAAAGAPIAGSILSAPPDLAVAGRSLIYLAVLARPGRVVHVEMKPASRLAEYPLSGFPGGAEQVPPWLISGSGHAGPRPTPVAGQRAQPDVPAVGSVAPNASPRPVRSTESRACAGTWSRNGRIASRAARISRPT